MYKSSRHTHTLQVCALICLHNGLANCIRRLPVARICVRDSHWTRELPSLLGIGTKLCRKTVLRVEPLHETCIRWRPYRVECTGSLLTSEVKRRRARLVLGWGTAREDLRVLSAFLHSADVEPHDGSECAESISPFPALVQQRIGARALFGRLPRSERITMQKPFPHQNDADSTFGFPSGIIR